MIHLLIAPEFRLIRDDWSIVDYGKSFDIYFDKAEYKRAVLYELDKFKKTIVTNVGTSSGKKDIYRILVNRSLKQFNIRIKNIVTIDTYNWRGKKLSVFNIVLGY